MLKEKIEKALNQQIARESEASNIYLAMASWAETQGYEGTAEFLYAHSEEEREHMLKIFRYVNDRGGHAQVPANEQPPLEYKGIKEMFQAVLDHEIKVSEAINNIVGVCLDEKDYTTNSFLQWFVNEQIEEESLAQKILDKLELLGDDKAKMYMFDRDIAGMREEGQEE